MDDNVLMRLNHHGGGYIVNSDTGGFIMKKYKAKIKHDNGVVNITTSGVDILDATKKILISEGCPLSSIKEIKELKQ